MIDYHIGATAISFPLILLFCKKSHAKFAEFRKDYAGKLCSSLMEDYAKTYFASLVCSHPDGKAQAKRVRLCVIKISCTRSTARSLRSLRTLRENIKREACTL